MSVTPLIDLIQRLEQPSSPDSLLRAAMPVIASSLPGAAYARFYRMGVRSLRLSAASDGAPHTELKLDDAPLYAAALEQQIIGGNDELRVAPVTASGEVVGLLEVGFNAPPSLDSNIDEQVGLTAFHLGLALHSLEGQDLLERQARAFTELNANQDYEQMAAAVARHMLPGAGRFVCLSRFVYDAHGALTGWRVLAASTQEGRVDWSNSTFKWESVSPALREATMAGKPFITADLSPSEFGPEWYALFAANGVKSFVHFPVLHEGKPSAALGVASRTAETFTRAEITAFANVADQVGALIHTRSLVAEAQTARDVANNLVLASRMITAARSYDDMAQAVMYTVARQMTATSITLFEQQGAPERGVLVAAATADGPLSLEAGRFSQRVPSTAQLDSLRTGTPIVLPAVFADESPLSDETQRLLSRHGVTWRASFGLRAGDSVIGTLDVMHSQPRAFTAEELDAYHTLADQIAITLENQSLLKQTEDALAFVQMQFESASKIYAAENDGEILEAMHRFAGSHYLHAHLGLVEGGTTPQARIVAEISHNQLTATNRVVGLDSYPASETLTALETLYLPDVAADQFIDEAERARLRGQDVGAMVIVPLVSNQRLTGVITFTNPAPQPISPNRLRGLRALADQAATVFENRALLKNVGDALAETQILYEVNRAILAAQDTLDVLRELRGYLAPDAAVIGHSILKYDENGRLVDMVASHLNSTADEQVLERSWRDLLGEDMLAAAQTYWQAHPDSVVFIEDVNAPESEFYPQTRLARRSGAAALIDIPVREHNQVRDLITVTFSEPRQFTPEQRRLYESLADQIGLVMQSHRLLHDAQLSAGQLSSQVRVLQIINRLAVTLNTIQDEQALLNEGARALTEATGVDHCGIVLVDAAETVGTVAAEYPQAGAVGVQLDLAENEPFQIIRETRRPLVVDDLKSYTQMSPATRDALLKLNIKALAVLPLIVHGRIFGSIGIDLYTTGKRFTQDIIDVAQTIAAQMTVSLQNVRLLHETQRSAEQLGNQVRVLQIINRLSATMSAVQDEQALLNESARSLTEAIGVDHCGILLVNPSETVGIVAAEHPSMGMIGTRIELSDNEPFYIIRETRRPLVVNDLATDTRIIPATREALLKLNIRELAFIPVFVHERIFGSIGLDLYGTGKSFTQDMIDVAQTIAAQMAVSLQNIRLVGDMQRRAEQLQRIAAFSQSVQATLDLGTIFNIMIAESRQMLTLDQMSISLYDAAKGKLYSVAQHVDSRTTINLNSGDTIPISGFIAQVWEKWELLHIPDLREAQKSDPGVSIRSWILVPLLSRGRILGLVSVGSSKPYSYSETDVAVYQQMVNQLAVAIENAEAYNQSQRLAKNEALVNEISAKLQRQLDIGSMMDVALNELGSTLGARRARIRLSMTQPNGDQEQGG